MSSTKFLNAPYILQLVILVVILTSYLLNPTSVFAEGRYDPLTDGLVGWWKLDESSANTCSGGVNDSCDSSGNGNDGEWGSGTTASDIVGGKFGNSLEFDATVNDRVYLGSPTSLNISGEMTISTWVQFDNITANNQTIIGQCLPGSSAAGQYALVMGDIDNEVRMWWRDTAIDDTSANFQTATWYHLIWTRSGSASNWTSTFYVNGEVDEILENITTNPGPQLNASIGDCNQEGFILDGRVDDVRIYNRALSPAEVSQLYNWAPPPVAYYSFDENTGVGSLGPGSGTNDNSYGSLAWTNPGNVTDSDDSRASVTLSGTTSTNYINSSNFGFAIPDNASITGITVEIERSRTGGTTGNVRDDVVRLVKAGSVVGDNKAATGTNWPTSEPNSGVRSYGGSSDLWGTTWTPQDVNSTDFGLVIAAKGDTASSDRVAEVDNVAITVHLQNLPNVVDRSGKEKHGIMKNMGTNNWMSGKFGSAANLDGVNDYIEVSSPSLPTGDFTYTAWINFRDITTNAPHVVGSSNGSGGNELQFYTSAFPTSDTVITLRIDGDAGTFGTSDLQDNTWYHVAATRQGSDIKLYVNGVVDGTGSNSNTLNFGSCPLLIGTDIDNGCTGSLGNWGNGFIDELKIYNYARTQDQIIEDMNGSHPKGGSPVGSQVGYWKFDEGYGSTANDSNLNANHLTLNNTPSWSQQGRLGTAIDFESSSSQNATIKSTSSLGLSSGFTLSAWINPESTTASTSFGIIQKNDGSYKLEQYGAELRLYIGSDSNYITSTNATLATGTWYHVLGAYSGATQTAELYLNGKKLTTSTTGSIPSSITAGSGDLAIGGSTTKTITLSQSSDDARQVGTTVTLNGTTLESDATNEYLGFRFQNIHIPQGATINSAHLTFNFPNSADDEPLHNINAENIDNAPTFTTTASDISNRTLTTAQASWSNTDLGAPGIFNTPSLTSVVQEVVNRGGWVAGNSMVFVIVSTGTATRDMVVTAWDHASDPEPTFTFSYGTSNYYDGLIDEVKIYSAALTPEQIKIDYNRGKAAVLGSTGTTSTGVADNSAAREYCIPGDTSTCNAPVGHWTLDENTGSTANDKSGNGNTGTLIGNTTWAPGIIGQAIELDGNDDEVNAGSASVLDDLPASGITVSAWIKPRTCTGDENYLDIVTKSTNNNPDNGWVLACRDSTDALNFWAGYSGTPSYIESVSQSDVISMNKWQYVAATWDGSATASNIRLYLDGRDVTLSGTNPGGSRESDASESLFIGGIGTGGSSLESFNGFIDDVRVYNYVRTPAQITWDFNRGAPIGWWKLDECSGTTAFDSAKNGNGDSRGNHGTITIGTSGSNTSAGTCNSGTGTEAWNNGTTGKRNASLDFDGTDDYVEDADAESYLNGLTAMSIAMWIKSDQIGTDRGFLTGNSPDTGDNGLVIRYDVDGANGGGTNVIKLAFGNATGGDSANSRLESSSDVQTTEWQHIVATWQGGQAPKLYINGTQDTPTFTSSGGTSIANLSFLRIGQTRKNTSPYWDGKIDDFRIYNYALTAEQVKLLYNSGAVSFRP